MKLGYFTMPLHPPGSNQTETLEEDLEQLIRLDELESILQVFGKTYLLLIC